MTSVKSEDAVAVNRLKHFTKWLPGVPIVIGVISLVGWKANVPELTNIVADWPTMKINTALSFVLMGISLVGLTAPNQKLTYRALSMMCAIAVLSISMLTLFEYMLDLDLGIDQLFGMDKMSAQLPGRMSIMTATCFLLLSVSTLAAFASRSLAYISQGLALTALAFSTIGLLGYLFDAQSLSHVLPYNTMAINTVLAMFCLSHSVLFLFPTRGVMRLLFQKAFGSLAIRKVLPSTVVVFISICWTVFYGVRAGLYDHKFGFALLVGCQIPAFVFLFLKAAKLLNAMDGDRIEIYNELQKSNSTLKKSQELSKLGSWRHYLATNHTSCSEEAAFILELHREQSFLTFDVLVEFVHPEEKEMFLQHVNMCLSKRQATYFEHRIVCRSGHIKYVRTCMELELINDKTPHSVLGTMQDITEKKEIEIALKRSEEEYRAAVEAMPQILWITDEKGKFIFGNSRYYEYLGNTTALGGEKNLLVHPEDREEALSLWKKSLETGSVYENELRMKRHSDGEFRWHFVRAVPFLNEYNKIVKWFGASMDIHDKKEAAVLKYREQVAQQATELKSEFLANISHETRTPLNAIVGSTDLLLETYLSDYQRELIEIIKNSSENMLTLLNDILDYSKIEAKKVELEKTPFAFNELMASCGKSAYWLAKQKQIEFRTYTDDEAGGLVLGDPSKIRQVVSNLISNAIKFTSKGYVELRSRVRNISSHKVEIYIEVRDTGIGIEPTSISKIFNPFTQAESSTTRRFGGTGLGLSISKELVELMGGDIGVQSEPGIGSLFWFSIELDVLTQVDLNQKQIPTSVDEPLERRVLSQRKILLVEDIDANQRVMEFLLKSYGLECVIASNGREALELVVGKSFDLILMDCHMPEMDGFSTTQQLLQMPEFGDTPIIAMTADASQETQERCHVSGMRGLLIKPVHKEALEQVLNQWLSVKPLLNYPERASNVGSSNETVDFSVLGKLKNLAAQKDPSIKVKMLSFLEKSIPVRINALGMRVKNRDLDSIGREAHGLKSATCYFGAARMGRLCEEITSIAQQKKVEKLEVVHQQIETEYAILLEAVRNEFIN